MSATASQPELMAVFREGVVAKAAGHRFEDCPYSDALRCASWEEGWTRGTRSRRDTLNTPEGKGPDYMF